MSPWAGDEWALRIGLSHSLKSNRRCFHRVPREAARLPPLRSRGGDHAIGRRKTPVFRRAMAWRRGQGSAANPKQSPWRWSRTRSNVQTRAASPLHRPSAGPPPPLCGGGKAPGREMCGESETHRKRRRSHGRPFSGGSRCQGAKLAGGDARSAPLTAPRRRSAHDHEIDAASGWRRLSGPQRAPDADIEGFVVLGCAGRRRTPKRRRLIMDEPHALLPNHPVPSGEELVVLSRADFNRLAALAAEAEEGAADGAAMSPRWRRSRTAPKFWCVFGAKIRCRRPR